MNVIWYKEGCYWRKKSTDGSDGKGDLIFNTCYKILQDGDYSEWAYEALEACSILLLDGKRWPDYMNDDTDCKTWAQRIFNRTTREILKFFGITIHSKFRYQGRMTRDPFIAFYTLSLFLDHPGYIDAVPIPWYLYSPNTWRWRRRLIEDKRKDYVIRLGYLRDMAGVLNYEQR